MSSKLVLLYSQLFNATQTEDQMPSRTEINRALAKAIAYRDCGKPAEVERWARELVRLLGAAEILK